MAGVVEEIFRINNNAAEVIKDINQIKGAYEGLSEEQEKQLKILKDLQNREKELIAARARSTNPTTTVKYTKEIAYLNNQIKDLKTETDKFTAAEVKATTQTDKLSKSVSNAFKGTVLAAAAKDMNTLGKSFEDGAANVENVEKKTISLKAQLKALKDQLASGTLNQEEFQKVSEEAGVLKDRIDDANEAAKAFASGSKFQIVGNQIGDIATKLLSLDFEGAAERSEQLVATSKQITFKESIQGVKQIGTTLFNLGKALLTNPLFLIATVISLAIANFDKFKNSTGLLGDAFRFIGKIIDGVIETFYALTDALNITQHAMDDYTKSTIANAEELAERNKKAAEQQIAIAKELGIATEKQEKIKQVAYIKTLQVALEASRRRSFLTDDEAKAQKELVDKINDARNELDLIEARSFKKRKDEAKKYADDINKLFDDLDKRIRDERTKESEFNIKFKFEDGSQKQLEAVYALRKKLEDQELKELSEASIKIAKNEKDRAIIREKLLIISNQVAKNRNNDYNKAVLDADLERGNKEIAQQKEHANKLIDASNDSEKNKAAQRITIEEDGYYKSLQLLEKNIQDRKKLGLNVVEYERQLNDLKFNNDIYLAQQEKELLQLNFQAAEEDLNFRQAHEQAVLTLKNKANSSKLYADLKYEKDRLLAIEQAYGKESQMAQAQQDKIKQLQKEAFKQRVLEYTSYFETITNAAIAATNSLLNTKIQESDKLISLQQTQLEKAQSVAERGNAELLQLEEKRLDDLNKQKERYVRQQQALATIELISNTAITVSKAAAEGGVAAGVTIAAALIALIAGLASARSIASQAAFYEGGLYNGQGYTGTGNPFDESMGVGKKPYTYHKEEFIFNHQTTRNYRDIFEDIHGGRINLNEWKKKVSAYDQMANFVPFSMNANLGVPEVHYQKVDMSGVESRLDANTRAIENLQFGLNIDHDGFTMSQKRIIERKEFLKQVNKL